MAAMQMPANSLSPQRLFTTKAGQGSGDTAATADQLTVGDTSLTLTSFGGASSQRGYAAGVHLFLPQKK